MEKEDQVLQAVLDEGQEKGDQEEKEFFEKQREDKKQMEVDVV